MIQVKGELQMNIRLIEKTTVRREWIASSAMFTRHTKSKMCVYVCESMWHETWH